MTCPFFFSLNCQLVNFEASRKKLENDYTRTCKDEVNSERGNKMGFEMKVKYDVKTNEYDLWISTTY